MGKTKRTGSGTSTLAMTSLLTIGACIAPGRAGTGDSDRPGWLDGHDSGEPNGGGASGESGDTEPVVDPGPSGVYDAHSVWTLSLPVDANRGAGDRVSDRLIAEIVSALGVPSQFEDDARDAVAAAVGNRIADAVDAVVPEELRRGGALWTHLAAVSTQAEVDSTLTLTADEFHATGREVVDVIAYEIDGERHEIRVDEMVADSGDIVELAADWSATVQDSTLTVAPHQFAISFRPLADRVAVTLTGETLADIADLSDVVSCGDIAEIVTGDDGEIGVSYYNVGYSVDVAEVEGLCLDALAQVEARILATFDVGVGVTAGGHVLAADTDLDGIIDTLASSEDFGGAVTIAGVHAANAQVALTASKR